MHSLILCSLNRISCGAVVNWYKQRLSNVHTILKKNALCVHTYSLAYTLTHVRMISPQEKKTKKKQHTQTWIISWRTKRSDLCKDSSFTPQSSSVSSQFHILSGCVKKIQQREIGGEIQGLLSIWLSIESESCYMDNEISRQTPALQRKQYRFIILSIWMCSCTVTWHKSNYCVCWLTDFKLTIIKMRLYSCNHTCSHSGLYTVHSMCVRTWPCYCGSECSLTYTL